MGLGAPSAISRIRRWTRRLCVDDLPDAGVVEGAAAASVLLDAFHLLRDQAGIDGPGIAGRRWRDKRLVLGRAFGGCPQAFGALALVRDVLPTEIAGDLRGFLADEILGHELSVYKPGHADFVVLMSTMTPPVTSGTAMSGKPQGGRLPVQVL